MVKLVQGNILEAEVDALVNTVNCVGVMGRGVALQFRKAYPENFKVYKRACDQNELHPGQMLTCDLNSLSLPRYIINFPTKLHWKSASRLEYIDSGLQALIDEVKRRNIRSIAIPPLGCGLGGLRWRDVFPRINEAFKSLPDVQVSVYEPIGAPTPNIIAKDITSPVMTISRAVLLELSRRYLMALMDPFITLLEIHKLMYLVQEAGEPLKLNFVKAVYGPYAVNLRHALNRMDGHFLIGYGEGADNPSKRIELLPDAIGNAAIYLNDHARTLERVQRVADLIDGLETPYGMELLATVHWVATREHACDAESVISRVHGWNDRKQQFKASHVRLVYSRLLEKGWLTESGITDLTPT